MPTVGSMLNGAFRLVRDHPGAVALWGLIYMAISLGGMLVMRPLFAMQAATLGDKTANPMAMMAGFWSTMRWVFLANLVFFLVYMVIFTATQRAVLRPQEEGVGFLRLGMDEVRLIGLAVLLAVLFYVGMILVGIIFAIVFGVAMIGAAGTGGTGATAGAAIVMFFAMLALIGAAIWLWVRLSLAFPLTFLRRRIMIGESWTLTRGRFWSLFVTYLLILLIVLLIGSIVSMISAGSYFSDLMSSGFKPEQMMAAAQRQAERMSGFDALTLMGLALNGFVSALMVALLGGAAATAVRELAGDALLAREFS